MIPQLHTKQYYDGIELKSWLSGKGVDDLYRLLGCPHNGTMAMVDLDEAFENEEDYDEDYMKLCRVLRDELKVSGCIEIDVWW